MWLEVGPSLGIRRLGSAYARRNLFAALIVQFGVGLAENMVTLVFNTASFEVPVGSLVSGFGVDMQPDVGV